MKRYIISFMSIILVFALIASASSVSITIWGTNGNASGAQQNVTKYGANNSVNVSAWNVTKTVMVRSLNASGDTIAFNISNMTAWRVYEIKVNSTSINAYQAGENGMVNFSYSQNNSNVTYSISPATNANGINFTWAYIWNPQRRVMPVYKNNTVAQNTVYSANGSSLVIVNYYTDTPTYGGCISWGASNPPPENNNTCGGAAATYPGNYGQVIAFMNSTDYYKIWSHGSATLSNIRVIKGEW